MAFGRKKQPDPRFTRSGDLDPTVTNPALAELRKRSAEEVRAKNRAYPTPRPSGPNYLAGDDEPPRPLQQQHEVVKPRIKKLATWKGITLWEDRLVGEGFSMPLTAGVAAEVHESGAISVERRPTLTRMAVGAVLPGTALVPGLAFQKKTIHDGRQLLLVIESARGPQTILVHPDLGTECRHFAAQINSAVKALGAAEAAPSASVSEDGLAASLERLAKLHSDGALTAEEFAQAKQRLLAPGT